MAFVGIFFSDKLSPPKPPEISYTTAIMYNQQGSLHQGWNMVSLPGGHINKTNVIITYKNHQYTWAQAITMHYIFDTIYSYDGTGYVNVNYFEDYQGVWMYSYKNNITLSSNLNIVYCGNLNIQPQYNYTLTAHQIIVAPGIYSNTINCSRVIADEVIFRYLNINEP